MPLGGLVVFALLAGALLPSSSALAGEGEAAAPIRWKTLQPGLEYAVVAIGTATERARDGLRAVRIAPELSPLEAVFLSEQGGDARTAAQWCQDKGLAAAINLGMYKTDMRSNVGYARRGRHVNSPGWKSAYKSALLMEPAEGGRPQAVMVDLDEPGGKARARDYGTVVQNLRLVKGPAGASVWQKKEERWSEAAVAMDDKGRILFLFCRRPLPMDEFNRLILSIPLGVVRAMHVEGGTQASLSIHAGGVDLDLGGSYETGLAGDGGDAAQRPIPNILGVPLSRGARP